ncbi:hypothetical protein CFOL_v3_26775 [Cephalotus follicularis]|uniref:Uncharacterized protein n=1 Tax=Cephalotus follicularis TaxID=3775 RepID=A0A1Q3CSX1_CEPFO|nr:hypothetical protein CFOL_v3_26775 [Cephalotus follicularis]
MNGGRREKVHAEAKLGKANEKLAKTITDLIESKLVENLATAWWEKVKKELELRRAQKDSILRDWDVVHEEVAELAKKVAKMEFELWPWNSIWSLMASRTRSTIVGVPFLTIGFL